MFYGNEGILMKGIIILYNKYQPKQIQLTKCNKDFPIYSVLERLIMHIIR